jgi:membrane protein
MTDRHGTGRRLVEAGDATGRFASTVAGAARGFVRDDGPLYAAALAYYALFSLFPLLLVAAVVYASLVSQDRVVADATRLVEGYVPDQSIVERTVTQAIAHRASVGLGSLIFLLIGATRLFDAVVAVLNCAAQAPRPSNAKRLGQSVLLTVSAGAVGAVVLGLTALGHTEAVPGGRLGELAVTIGPAVLTFLVVAFLYWFVPNRTMDWSRVWRPALVVALGQMALKVLLFAWVQRHYARYDAIYGSLGVAVVALIWLYANAALFLLGAEAAAGERVSAGEVAGQANDMKRSGERLAKRLQRAGG